jgi:sensor domain CHASE-containing protein
MKIALLSLILLSACGGTDSTAPQAKIAQEQRAALEKAKGVETELQKEAQQTQQAVEKQTQ